MEKDVLTERIDMESLKDGLSYPEYRKLVADLLSEGKVTGHEQKESYLEYTRLNEVRMNRWEKHFVPAAEIRDAIQNIRKPQVWMVITEGWCGDGAQILPALQKVADLNPLIHVRYFLRDDHDGLMQKFLTNGTRSIPIVAALQEDGTLIWKWGPRPQAALALIAQAKAEDIPAAKWKESLHLWYARDKQEHFQHELLQLLKG